MQEESVTPAEGVKYIRVVNNATGSMHIQGIKIAKPGEGGSEGTGISSVETETAGDTRRYNISGQRITSPRSGQVYIQNGKKYVK